MRILLDAMGGDNAPEAVVQGALDAVQEFQVELTLVGRGPELLEVLRKKGIETLPKGLEISHAPDVVDMHANPTTVLKDHPESSMVQGLKLLRAGEGDAFVSAGNTGALLTGATLECKRIRGIRRAAMGPVIPSRQGGTVLIDAGANVDCTAEYLLQFGYMGAFYASRMLGRRDPRVGLLSNGSEDTKGGALRREAYALLSEAKEAGRMNFVGNVEARDAFSGDVDVIVADGFSGNVLLKAIEGTAGYLMSELKGVFSKNLITKLGAACVMGGLKELKGMMDYRESGGTVLLGISKPVIKAHGSSDARAIRSAVRQAMEVVNSGLVQAIEEKVDAMRVDAHHPGRDA